ncbi:GPP34 family phosphoprotein [Streptomyces sp. NPDC020996]|uniref:GPP34 family phosphoprotein n=1 Tax=Streptomyces sp. NPDC020996 TaxID=3154791 RepID=UPI0033F64311
MSAVPSTTLPEDLLLLHTHPRTGALKPPRHTGLLLAGAMLTELLLRGALTVRGSRVALERQAGTAGPRSAGPSPADPLSGDPLLAELLRRLRDAGGGSRSAGLEHWVREAASPSTDVGWLKLLTARGLAARRPRRLLGVLDVGGDRLRADPGWSARLASRVAGAVRSGKGGPAAGPSDARDLHLAALIGASAFVDRLPAPFRDRGLVDPVMDLAFELPIADATRELLQAAGSGGRGDGIDLTDNDWGFLSDNS